MRRTIGIALRIFGLMAILPLATLHSSGARQTEAGSLLVTTTTDSGPGSFRQALIDAGNNPGLDTITFDPAVFPESAPATIQPITNYVIEGAAASQPLTVDGTGAGVVIDAQFVDSGAAALHFRPSGPLSGLTLKHFFILNFHPDSGGNGIEVGFQVTDVSAVTIDEMTVRGNDGHGLSLNASGVMSDVLIQNSEFSLNTAHGVLLKAPSIDDITIRHNEMSDNDRHGLEFKADTSPSPATLRVEENMVELNGETGVGIFSDAANPSTHVTISRNTISQNGALGIDLGDENDDADGVTPNDPGDSDSGINNLLNFPVLNGVGPSGITGTACANCIVELFIADSDPSGHGEGANFFASGTADGDGNFDINGCGQNGGANVTATATDPDGNTSEFAENYILPTTPSCSELNGDLDCDGDFDPRDALIAVIHDAGATQISREAGCPELGSALPASLPASTPTGPTIFGDVNCDTDVNAGDGITILQEVVEVSLVPDPPAGCVPLGEPLPQ